MWPDFYDVDWWGHRTYRNLSNACRCSGWQYASGFWMQETTRLWFLRKGEFSSLARWPPSQRRNSVLYKLLVLHFLVISVFEKQKAIQTQPRVSIFQINMASAQAAQAYLERMERDKTSKQSQTPLRTAKPKRILGWQICVYFSSCWLNHPWEKYATVKLDSMKPQGSV